MTLTFTCSYVCTQSHLTVCWLIKMQRSFVVVLFGGTRGGGADSHRLASRVNPTAGGPSQSLTSEIRLTRLAVAFGMIRIPSSIIQAPTGGFHWQSQSGSVLSFSHAER